MVFYGGAIPRLRDPVGAGLEAIEISEASRDVRPLTSLNREAEQSSHRLPQALPGNAGLLYTVTLGIDFQDARDSSIVIQSAGGDRTTIAIEGI